MKLLIVLLGGIVVGYIIKDLLEKMLKKRNKVEKNKQETAPLVEKTIGIERLWSDGTEKQWQDALSHYGDLLRTDAKALEEVLGRIGAQGVGAMSVEEFYDFLYHKYYVWKYTQKNRLATTRKALRRYVEENDLATLGRIHQEMFRADKRDIQGCIKIVKEIRGLGVAGASGLLAVLFPTYFGTVDQFVVKSLRKVKGLEQAESLMKMNPEILKNGDAEILVEIMRQKAAELNIRFQTDTWTPRKIDMILWSIER